LLYKVNKTPLVTLSAIKSTTQQPLSAFFKLKPLPPLVKEENIFKDIDFSNNNKIDSIFKA
jgi:hypothetical protein